MQALNSAGGLLKAVGGIVTIAIIAGTIAAIAYLVAIWLERLSQPPSPGFGNDDCYLGKVAAPADLRGAGNSRASAAGTLTDTGHVRTHVERGDSA